MSEIRNFVCLWIAWLSVCDCAFGACSQFQFGKVLRWISPDDIRTLPINIWCSISIVCHNRQWIESYTLRWKIPCIERRVLVYHIFGFAWCVEGSNCFFKNSEKKPYYICIIREFHFQTSDVDFFSVVTVGDDCIGGLRNFLTNNITDKQHND